MPLLRLDDLYPKEDAVHVLDHWGDSGRLEADPEVTPMRYYLRLLAYMGAGGSYEPIEVGYHRELQDERIYVFDGHHRAWAARELGWTFIEIRNSANPMAEPLIFAGADVSLAPIVEAEAHAA